MALHVDRAIGSQPLVGSQSLPIQFKVEGVFDDGLQPVQGHGHCLQQAVFLRKIVRGVLYFLEVVLVDFLIGAQRSAEEMLVLQVMLPANLQHGVKQGTGFGRYARQQIDQVAQFQAELLKGKLLQEGRG